MLGSGEWELVSFRVNIKILMNWCTAHKSHIILDVLDNYINVLFQPNYSAIYWLCDNGKSINVKVKHQNVIFCNTDICIVVLRLYFDPQDTALVFCH